MKRFFLLLPLITLYNLVNSQTLVQGNVSTLKSDPLIGVNILIKGTSLGTVSNDDGKFEITVPTGSNTLILSYTGFITKEVLLTGASEYKITLEENVETLADLVVVGYGSQSKRFKVQSISQIDQSSLQNKPLISPQELLQGRAAGVQMVGNSGVLGSNATVRIRGAASLNAGGNPLFVMDGVPLNDGVYSNGLGGAALNPLADVNPNDIESISVLKDAAAVAIYGSRGANGVVLITTKKGVKGTNTVNLDVYTGWSKPTFTLDIMNADEYRKFMLDYNKVSLPNTSFDWPSAVLRTGKITNTTLSFNGGNETTQYYLGGTYNNQSSYTIGNELNKLNGRLNFNHKFSSKLSFGANVGISRSLNDRISSENSTFAPLTSAYLQLPTVEPKDKDGKYVNTGFVANVLAIEELSIRNLLTERITGNTYFILELLKGLSIKTDFGIDNVSNIETTRDPDIVAIGGSAANEIARDNKWLTTNTLNFNKAIGAGVIDLVGGISFETALFEENLVAGSSFAADGLRNVASAAIPTTTNSNRTEWALFSQFIRTNYKLKDRYIIEGSLRRDGSSRFGANNRWGTFYSISGGWVISAEPFFKLNFINQLKITGSYGISGNDRIGNFISRGLYGSGTVYDYAGLPGLGPSQAENPNLKWEETEQMDIGMAMQLLKNKLSLNVNYYIKNTNDLILAFPLADVNGINSIQRNAGKMRNSGVDFELGLQNINLGPIEWNSSFNFGYLKNKVLSLPGAALDAQGRRYIGGANQRAIEGHQVNTYYAPEYKGINPETGDAEWYDLEGKPQKTPSANYRVINGSPIPDFTGGFSNTFSYKGFELDFLFNFSYGNAIGITELNFTENPISNFNKSRRLINYWTESNKQKAFAPAPTSNTRSVFANTSTLSLFDGSFLRLRNITMGYTLKNKNAKYIKYTKIYLQGQNIWTLRDPALKGRGADPEVGYVASNLIQGVSFFTPPPSKMITLGISAGF